jgi:putative Ca2+/H+ antiporter (TMEM165/GDT1 family)
VSSLPLGPLLITAATIFVAELGDKTLFTVLILSSRGSPLWVGLGAAAAFVVQSCIAVTGGRLLAFLPALAVRLVTAGLFAVFGLILLFKKEEEEEHTQHGGRGPFLAAFVLVFVAEWGDMTQIGTATLVARFGEPMAVFVGAVLGLWAGTVVAVLVGWLIGTRFPVSRIRLVAGVIFLLVAVGTLFAPTLRPHLPHFLQSI